MLLLPISRVAVLLSCRGCCGGRVNQVHNRVGAGGVRQLLHTRGVPHPFHIHLLSSQAERLKALPQEGVQFQGFSISIGS